MSAEAPFTHLLTRSGQGNGKTEALGETLDLALKASGCNGAPVRHKAQLLSDKGPSYSGDGHSIG